jgi:serine-type D-Ala-D-Ala carboxypeptidase
MTPSVFERARGVLEAAVGARAFPAAAVDVGTSRRAAWQQAFGRLTFEPDAPAAALDTVFDLASLTKVIATTTLVMDLMQAGRLGLDDRVARWIPEWVGTDRDMVTVGDLLAHCSGLTSYLPFYRDHDGRAEFERAIAALPLEYRPRTQSIYSDLGFILLGFLCEEAAGRALRGAVERAGTSPRRRDPGLSPAAAVAPGPRRRRSIRGAGGSSSGEVDDRNAWALGGVAGHAGLFGTARQVGDFARAILDTFGADTSLARRRTLEVFAARTTDIPGSTRALGWDTMLPTSSCGTRLSPRAIGHTGFTGTSLWIDPEQDLYIALLTNRVHPTRQNNRLKDLRGAIHDAIVSEL